MSVGEPNGVEGRAAARAAPRSAPALERLRVRVDGAVHGVGFRAFACRLARRLGLSGSVRSTPQGMVLELEGTRCDAFLRGLLEGPPPLAKLKELRVEHLPPERDGTAFVVEDPLPIDPRAAAGPDLAVCTACLTELFQPASPYYRYPFVSCAQCGPRFSLRHAERPACPACHAAHADALGRRHHAPGLSCPACGPKPSLAPPDVLAALRAGRVVALKDVGGFRLLCDAKNADAVARLRSAKGQRRGPVALLVGTVASARQLVDVGELEASVLGSARRPVVLLRSHSLDGLAPGVNSDLPWLALRLPATPLEHLLFNEAAGRPDGLAWLDAPVDLVLVVSSANPGGAPPAADSWDERLDGLAEVVVTHDLPVALPLEDSVVRAVSGAPALLRRARGFAPEPVQLPEEVPPVLALGARRHVTVCLTRGREAFVSQHLGDLREPHALAVLEETVDHLTHLLGVQPEVVAHDRNPALPTSVLASKLGLRTAPVQHHHAHVMAVLAEHGRRGRAVGLALDGYGLVGTEAWGGELLEVDGANFRRLGHLLPLKQPGGERVEREPWRMGASVLHRLGRVEELKARFEGFAVDHVLAALDTAPETTATGRYFDAAASLLGVRLGERFEGEAGLALEGLVRRPRLLPRGWRVEGDVLDLLPLFEVLLGCGAQEGAELFHGTLAAGLVDLALPALAQRKLHEVVLSGGCLVNNALAEALMDGFARHGVQALLPRALPANDGGLSLGQAWVVGQAVTP